MLASTYSLKVKKTFDLKLTVRGFGLSIALSSFFASAENQGGNVNSALPI
jgi:hypothetical protein